MLGKISTAIAHPNIAFIKYWGNQDDRLRLPANGSISMNLAGLQSKTSVTFDGGLERDEFLFAGKATEGQARDRVSEFLDIVRQQGNMKEKARVESENNFPMGSGIASSSSAFAALALAASDAAGVSLDERELSILARKGSGSASRSIPSGFVEWHAGKHDEDSFAESIASPDHWDIIDCIAIVDEGHKSTGSTKGHTLAKTSPLQEGRLAQVRQRIAKVRSAIMDKNFGQLAEVVEEDSYLMHAVMMTSSPRLIYWQAASLEILKACQQWREDGLQLCTTMDAGPNVHVLCLEAEKDEIVNRLENLKGVRQVMIASPGGAASLTQ